MKRFSISLIAMLLLGQLVYAQGFLRTEGKDIVNEAGEPYILKGMGLGGWMLQEGYMLQTAGFASAQFQIKEKITELIGEADMELFYEAWLENHVQKSDIDLLKSWGFNSVRLPMHYNLFTLSIEEEPVEGENTWLDKGFILTDSLISWCAQNEMYVILDMHAAPGGQGYDQAISDYDPSKPSIFESVPNRRKCASLWKRIAERYVNEPWVAGYDLINEPNWDLGGGNAALANIYNMITDSIRAVDQQHMIFIEGNWFANDFNGLTPPWDDNMVYSPHKYWSHNDQASIQWVLDMREEHNVPLYLGETGENSNTWFHDAIELFDEHNIGWAWWPMKKVESIAGPLTVFKKDGYQTLLDYWNNGGTAPSAAFAKAALMELAEDFKTENCHFQKDVIDAMFRQQTTDETIPFKQHTIPGVIHATDFNMGKNGFAYLDTDIANYNVSTGNFTAWNTGWQYRNDGVDIEQSIDNVNSNGYSVGWIGAGEWMQYDVEVSNTAVYDVELRVAANATGGAFHFDMDGGTISPTVSVASTGGWANWQTILVEDVILNENDKKLVFYCDAAGFNVGSFEFIEKGATTELPAQLLSAQTTSASEIQIAINKDIAAPLPTIPANFEIQVNSSPVSINAVSIHANNNRLLDFVLDYSLKASDIIRISYPGTDVLAADATALEMFTLAPVKNTLAFVHAVPGRIEAEDFFAMSGIQLENSSDIGGGQNIGYLDPGDYADYYIDVNEPGLYKIDYRTAAESATGGVQLQLIDDGNVEIIHNVNFPPTGGWQTWETTSREIEFTQSGLQHLRLSINEPQFNINWMELSFIVDAQVPSALAEFQIFPNPSSDNLYLTGALEKIETIRVYNIYGQLQKSMTKDQFSESASIDMSQQPAGNYIMELRLPSGEVVTEKIVLVK